MPNKIRLVRIDINIRMDQDEWLVERSRDTGESMAEIIRGAIDRLREEVQK